MASVVEESVDVQVPLATAYDEWTRFEQLPRFMAAVREVREVDDTHLRWRTEIDGEAREFQTEITELRPYERVAVHGSDGVVLTALVTFHQLDEGWTRVMVQLQSDREDLIDVKGDLERFKALVEGGLSRP